jgi:hypothetical protein
MTTEPKFQRSLDRAIKACLFLLALSAPLSIAATQTAWSFGLLFWIIRCFVVRPRPRKAPIDLAILAFTGLTIFSSFLSYEPRVSLKKLVAVSLVTIVYLVSEHVGDTKTIRRIVTIMLISGVASVFYTLGVLAVGKDLKLVKLTPDSPLRSIELLENDTILRANGRDVASPAELAAAMAFSEQGVIKLLVYRHELIIDTQIPAASIPADGDDAARFGIVEWSRGRDTRAAGFFGHYTTYAEALQLMMSVAFGLLLMSPGHLLTRNRFLLAASVLLFVVGLFLTVTRASWAGFAVSAAVMTLLTASRKTILVCILSTLPVAAAGLWYLQQKRNVGFIDTADYSTTWRMTVWNEAIHVLASSPRHLAVGIGMDSLKTHWMDWHMFDNGNQPLGHLHSTPLQIAFERGVPTLIAWLAWMFIYIRMLRRGSARDRLDWHEKGLLLGALGGTAGFLTSGLVHYNWGDSEVVMIFYLVMGLSLATIRNTSQESA